MAINQPEPGAQLHDGPVTTPRAAATVVLLRSQQQPLEVLLVKRNPEARFMGGAWVFPGGSVSPEDGAGQSGLQAAARRELSEEVSVELPATVELVPFARWITPEVVRTRFDTWFYLAMAPADAQPRVDGEEIVDARWLAPSEALSGHAAGELFLVFPTIKQLQQLSAFESATALLDYARGREVGPVQPRVVGSGEQARILLPGEPGCASDC